MLPDALNEATEIARRAVSVVDIADALGLEHDRNGRCRCPFHNGNDRNMKLYPGERGFYCFVCHEYGDSVKLARKLLPDMTFREIIEWMNDAFNLGIPALSVMPSVNERRRRAEQRAKAKHSGQGTDSARQTAQPRPVRY